MFNIWQEENGTVQLSGRLDASQVTLANSVMDTLQSTCAVDFSALEYISSAGLGVLLATQQRLADLGQEITIRGLGPHIRMVFDLAGFDAVFTIE
jgi:anti-anti-sigma factor